MKPFVAVAVLVAASLSAASAAPSQHQQVAAGAQGGGLAVGQRPSLSGSFQSQNVAPGLGGFAWPGAHVGGWSVGSFPGNGFGAPSGAAPGLAGAGGAQRPGSAAVSGNRPGSFLSQAPSAGSYVFGQYPVGWGSGYYFPGQSYGPGVYGQNGGWGYVPGFWGLAGNGYGGDYGSAYPGHFGQFSYGGFGGQNFGGLSGQAGVGQVPAAVASSGRSGARRSSSQRPAGRSQ